MRHRWRIGEDHAEMDGITHGDAGQQASWTHGWAEAVRGIHLVLSLT